MYCGIKSGEGSKDSHGICCEEGKSEEEIAKEKTTETRKERVIKKMLATGKDYLEES